MNAGALHFAFHKIEPEWNHRREPRVLHSWERREFLTKRSIQILRAYFVEAAEACVDFNKERRVGTQSRIDRSRFRSAANEQGRGGDERERKRDLRDHKRIARKEFPTQPARIFAGLLFQISNH